MYCTNCGRVGCDDDCELKEAPFKCEKCEGTMHEQHEDGMFYECCECFHCVTPNEKE